MESEGERWKGREREERDGEGGREMEREGERGWRWRGSGTCNMRSMAIGIILRGGIVYKVCTLNIE